MPTKAELLDQIAILEDDLTGKNIELWDAKAAEVEARGEVESFKQALQGLSIWHAHASPGEPLCISSKSGDPEFTLTIYVGGDGEMEGVIIGDEDGRTEWMSGKVPAKAVLMNMGKIPF